MASNCNDGYIAFKIEQVSGILKDVSTWRFQHKYTFFLKIVWLFLTKNQQLNPEPVCNPLFRMK